MVGFISTHLHIFHYLLIPVPYLKFFLKKKIIKPKNLIGFQFLETHFKYYFNHNIIVAIRYISLSFSKQNFGVELLLGWGIIIFLAS